MFPTQIEFLKQRLRPYKYALFRFIALSVLYWRRLTGIQTEPVIRRISLDSRRYLARKLAPSELVEAYCAIDSAQPFSPPPAKTIGQTRLTAPPPSMYREMFVVHLADVRVLGEAGHILTQDGTLLADISFRAPATFFANDSWSSVCAPHKRPEPLAGTTCLLTSKWAGYNYFHFMFELLPRCEMVRRSGIDLDAIAHFIVSPMSAKLYSDTLQELGVARGRMLICEEDSAFDVQSVIAPSTLRDTGHLRPWVCRWLNETFGKSEPNRKRTRLYAGRDDATSRRLTNQAEILEQLLAPLGFQSVRWDGGSIREQAALFADAEIVIGVNGAALANLVFCAPGTRVIVLHHPLYLSRYFYELCHTCGFDYYYLVGETQTPLKPDERGSDYFVSPATLAALLKLAGVN